MKRTIISIIGIIFLIGLTSCKKSDDISKMESEALKAAKSWLVISDNNDYSQCWDKASSYFKSAVNKNELVKSLVAVRKPLGKMISRLVDSKKYSETLPGTSTGKYVVVKFKTTFENKINTVETITQMREKDGKWRVSGYNIK